MAVIPLRPRQTRSTAWVHVHRRGETLVVEHESASGGSFGTVATFAADELEQAVAAALDAAATDYAPARLGAVALPLELMPPGGWAA